MAITVSGTTITFNDGSTQTTSVLNATAAASVGAVGTYAMLSRPAGDTTQTLPGNTVSGSSMRYAGGYSKTNFLMNAIYTTAPAGTWRCMGFQDGEVECGLPSQSASLFLRIS